MNPPPPARTKRIRCRRPDMRLVFISRLTRARRGWRRPGLQAPPSATGGSFERRAIVTGLLPAFVRFATNIQKIAPDLLLGAIYS